MHALIDGDIFAYEFGSCKDEDGQPLSWPLVQARVDSRIEGIIEATGAKTYQIYLTSEDKSNFRYEIASIRPYKGRRATEKPHWYQGIREFLVAHRGAQEVSGIEADDAISIEGWKDWGYKSVHSIVICSRDKDLDMIPGWHYSWGAGKQKEKELWWQDELSGIKCFYNQLLTGDGVDNIPGLYGVGKSSTFLDRINDCSSELAMHAIVLSEYVKRFGSYAEQFLLENARLLWLLQYEGQEWVPPTEREG